MSLLRVIKNPSEDDNYTTINLLALDYDNRLSWKAKALLIYLLSRPPDWTIRRTDLLNRSKDGSDALNSGLRELEDLGYLSRVLEKDDDGKFAGSIYEIKSRPESLVEYLGGSTVYGKTVTGKPVNGKPGHIGNTSYIEKTMSPGGDSVVDSMGKSNKPPLNPNGGRVEDFEEVWPHFPKGRTDGGKERRGSKANARAAWVKACTSKAFKQCRPPHPQIAIAILQHLAEDTEPEYIPLPTTFINKGRWEDWPDLMDQNPVVPGDTSTTSHQSQPRPNPTIVDHKFLNKRLGKLQYQIQTRTGIFFEEEDILPALAKAWQQWRPDEHGDVAKSGRAWVLKWVEWRVDEYDPDLPYPLDFEMSKSSKRHFLAAMRDGGSTK